MIDTGARDARTGAAPRLVGTGGMPAHVKALLGALAGMLGDRLLLLSLELELAKRALGVIAMLMGVAVVTALTAWTAFWLAIAGWLVALGIGLGVGRAAGRRRQCRGCSGHCPVGTFAVPAPRPAGHGWSFHGSDGRAEGRSGDAVGDASGRRSGVRPRRSARAGRHAGPARLRIVARSSTIDRRALLQERVEFAQAHGFDILQRSPRIPAPTAPAPPPEAVSARIEAPA